MTIIKQSKTKSRSKRTNVFEKVMAFWATINLTLVLFDISYLSLRDFWLQGKIQLFIKVGQYELEFPEYPVRILPISITNYYDWVKGIEPYRETEEYLKTVEKFSNQIEQIAINTLEREEQLEKSREDLEQTLAELRLKSKEMLETNPFQIANKTGTLERIKNKMRVHVFGSKNASAQQSFQLFWSKEHLIKQGIAQELYFFKREIKPLIETNYYRSIGENGLLVDNFGIIDFSFFTIYFLGEFLARTWYISRSHSGVKWLDAMLWRWYDLFFFLPALRWLRIIPVTIRLNQIGVIDLSAIQKQISQGFVANIAEDITEIVVIRIINQGQNLIAEGKIETILTAQSDREYIDINDLNEIVEIAKLLLELIINQVIPQIKPEMEALLTYSIEKSLMQSEAYQRLGKIPGFTNLQHNLTEQIIQQIYQIITDTLQGFLKSDQEFDKLLGKITNKFTTTMGSEIQAQESMDKIQNLLIDFLEEVKINYIQKLSAEDVEELLEEKRALQNKN
jgi:hypothetical protein